jgi:hypothetical protein
MFDKKAYMIEYNKKYYKENLDLYKQKAKKFKDNNPTYYKEFHKEYYRKNKEKQIKNHKEYYKKYPWKQDFISIVSRCKHVPNYKNRRGDITEEQLHQLYIKYNADKMECATVDRIDDNGVYTFNNIQYLEKIEHDIKSANEHKRNLLGQFQKTGE